MVQFPFELGFREMSKRDLRIYYSWFMEVLPKRVSVLEAAVRESLDSWRADFSPGSLDLLGEWFVSQVALRDRTKEEMDVIRSKLLFPVEVDEWELTDRTFSLALDVGMYFGGVVVGNVSGVKWDQLLKDRRYADYGQPVIVGLGVVPLNPVRICIVLAHAIASGEQGGARLRALYDTWAAMKSK